MVATALPVRDGDIVGGKYRVEQMLGTGGMGHVFSAVHIQLDQRVALKVMRAEHLDDADAVTRFEREARAASKLKSPHSARIMDVGLLPSGAPYMVMELLEGATLRAVLRQRGRLDPHEAATMIGQACDAIAEAHRLGLVHRDVKPSNLYVTRTSTGKPFIKVLDFGIVKALDHESESTNQESTLTKTHTAVGSPKYMAPEQVTSSKTVDRRADVWSLGACLYEMATGQPPFRAENLLDLGAKIVHEPEVDVREVRPEIAPELAAIIHRCLQKKPENRYADAGELAAALEDVLQRPASDPRLGATPSAPRAVVSPMAMTATAPAPFSAPPAPPPSAPIPFARPSSAQFATRGEDTGGSHGTGIAWGEAPSRSPSRVLPIVFALFGVVAAIGLVLVGVVVLRGKGTNAAAPSETSPAAAPSPSPPPPPPVVMTEAPPAHPPDPIPVEPAPTATPAATPTPTSAPAPTPKPVAPARPVSSTPAQPRPVAPAVPPRPAASQRAFDHL